MFAHQLEVSARILFPNCNLSKRDGDRAVAERIVPGLLHVIEIAPGYVHHGLMKQALFRSTCRRFRATLPGDASASCGLTAVTTSP
jgi:hypothetical protein